MTDCISPDGSYALKQSRKYVLNIFLNLISAAGSLFLSHFYHENVTLNRDESPNRELLDFEFQTRNFKTAKTLNLAKCS